jgi:hypothetical protein
MSTPRRRCATCENIIPDCSPPTCLECHYGKTCSIDDPEFGGDSAMTTLRGTDPEKTLDVRHCMVGGLLVRGTDASTNPAGHFGIHLDNRKVNALIETLQEYLERSKERCL